jgi:hypothetical protein
VNRLFTNGALPLLLAILLASGCARLGAVADTGAPTAPPTSSPDPCGAIGSVQAQVTLPEGMDFWDVFPNAGLAPELEGVSGIELIIYAGEVELTNVSGIPGVPRDTIVDNAVCVIMPEGDANLYYDVPREGLTIPGLSTPLP